MSKQKAAQTWLKQGFSLIELLIVVAIIGTLAAIALPNYTKAREHALGKEAIASLKIIAAAERILKLETNSFQACATTAACNTLLNLDISDNNWSYNVNVAGGVFEAFATRGSCVYRLASTFTSGEPVVSSGAGTCP